MTRSCASLLTSMAMIEEFDLDQDGAIDLREFTQIMLDDA